MGPIRVDTLEFGEFGIRSDRCYMLVNEKGRFVTQRSHPVLSQFHVERALDGFEVRFGNDQVWIPDQASTDRLVTTQVWKAEIKAREKSREVSAWFSHHLDEWVMLVEMDDFERRTVGVDDQPRPLMFADGYPLLVCNQPSLTALESSIGQTLGMQRWRPNVVISVPDEAEYRFSRLTVSGREGGYLALAKPCVRCNIPAIDPLTGVFSKSLHNEFSRRLLRDGKVIFGVNAAPVGLSTLSVGDQLLGE